MKVKIINLLRRPDRWETVVPEVEKFGITEFERFDAIEGGYMGFNKSVHYALENEGELLLLEDDCVFLGISWVQQNVVRGEVSGLYLGNSSIQNHKTVNFG